MSNSPAGVGDGGEESEACLRTNQPLKLDDLSFLLTMSIKIYDMVWVLTRRNRELERAMRRTLAIRIETVHAPRALVESVGNPRALCPTLSHGNASHVALLCMQFVFALMEKGMFSVIHRSP